MPQGDPAIVASGLGKAFGGFVAVDGIEFAVPRGSVYALLGPAGSGRSTTLRMLATQLVPDVGSATVLGHDVVLDPAAVRERIGLAGRLAAVDPALSGAENLIQRGLLLGLSWRMARRRAGQLLDALDLFARRSAPAAGYPAGLLRRLDLAVSLVGVPGVLLLDEPTAGLDRPSRQRVWRLIDALAAGGTTVLLTTADPDEAERLADRIGLLSGGRLIDDVTPAELRKALGSSGFRLPQPHLATSLTPHPHPSIQGA